MQHMQEIQTEDLELINGAGWLRDLFDDVRYVTKGLPGLYREAIESTSDMMCTATNKC